MYEYVAQVRPLALERSPLNSRAKSLALCQLSCARKDASVRGLGRSHARLLVKKCYMRIRPVA